MASGVRVDDSVIQLFQEMKLMRSGKKAVFFGFSKDEKFIIVEKGKEILSRDCNGDFFSRLKSMFPETKCSYALLDIDYITGESKKQDLIFVLWAPEDAPIKEKMLFASSKPYMKQVLSGVNKQWEIHSQDDLTIDQLAQKLCTGKIKSLEGHLI
ncbi:cofilin-2 isoform X1 [Pelobates cultripes]|uniref:Cofilin-2 isoform X1 n=2 Tax=Pelobates cultripes TaxID=61616 RepID=A0AAD1RGV3_PELCU|nr:cofilin-2 isoform X1 [Pelobates cultripes]